MHSLGAGPSMKLLIFGASGGTGRQLVEQALAQGHMVTAFVRNPAKFPIAHEHLRIAQGDALRYDAVELAVSGQDAVLSALGVHPPVTAFILVTILCQVAVKFLVLPRFAAWSISMGIPLLALLFLFRRSTKLSDCTRNIIRAIEQHGVRRFICQSSLGVGDSRGRLGFVYNFLVIPLFLRGLFADKAVQENLVRRSELDWVIVRPTALTNGPRKGDYRAGSDIGHWLRPTTISRADTADFMLKQVTATDYLRQTPGLADV
jgi:putative NADH-flavin reductase